MPATNAITTIWLESRWKQIQTNVSLKWATGSEKPIQPAKLESKYGDMVEKTTKESADQELSEKKDYQANCNKWRTFKSTNYTNSSNHMK